MVTSDDLGGDFKPERGVFVNRTLNMRSVEAVGYDMDYTLIHYKVDVWEAAAFDAPNTDFTPDLPIAKAAAPPADSVKKSLLLVEFPLFIQSPF